MPLYLSQFSSAEKNWIYLLTAFDEFITFLTIEKVNLAGDNNGHCNSNDKRLWT